MAHMIHYLAYGSNLHPLRLIERIPSAMLIGTVNMPGRELTFHKRSYVDGSGKCTFFENATAHMYGALFALDSKDESVLDRIEGLGQGYKKQLVKCPLGETTYEAFTYVATRSHIDKELSPYVWYKEIVLAGARYHGFPQDYIDGIKAVDAIQDPNSARRTTKENLLVTLRGI
ncbi:MAG: gamma-glutamylcyclotransferase [Gammaproteobacteria bacterium]|nr:gamma-glutamylcyclotransferase [Gammaproteobacteria bacterium]